MSTTCSRTSATSGFPAGIRARRKADRPARASPPARWPGEASKMSISTDYRRRIAEEERGAFNPPDQGAHMPESIVIVGSARTPMGSFQGDFSALSAHDLGGAAIKAAVERAGISGDAVGEVLFGNCLMAGQGQAPARQAAFKGGLPKSAGAVTLSKMCGSGMKAAMFAHDMLLAGTHEVMVTGGMESMTNAPYLMLKGRGGYRMGHDRIFDHMMLDGLEDAYEDGRSMGTFGEECAAKYQFTREAQDAFATASVKRAKAATESGAFAAEITPVTVKSRAGEVVISIDEGPGKVKLDKIPTLKPAFKKDGTITAASS